MIQSQPQFHKLITPVIVERIDNTSVPPFLLGTREQEQHTLHAVCTGAE